MDVLIGYAVIILEKQGVTQISIRRFNYQGKKLNVTKIIFIGK